MVTWMYWSKIVTNSLWLDHNILLSTKSPGNHSCIFRPHYVIFPTLLQVWTVVFKNGMIKPQFQNAQNLPLHHSSIILIYTLCSLCKGILSHKDLHPHTEISSERQDISEKKNITSYASHQLAHLSSSPWWAWKLVQRKLVVGTFSYQERHKEVSMVTCKQQL